MFPLKPTVLNRDYSRGYYNPKYIPLILTVFSRDYDRGY